MTHTRKLHASTDTCLLFILSNRKLYKVSERSALYNGGRLVRNYQIFSSIYGACILLI